MKLFYENNVYDWLEGYTQEYGGGFIWRRSLQHFKDIFNFKSDNNMIPASLRRDSTLRSSTNAVAPLRSPNDSTLRTNETTR